MGADGGATGLGWCGWSEKKARPEPRLVSREKRLALAGCERLRQTERQATFGAEADLFLARAVRDTSTSPRAHGTADQGALAPAGQRTNERAGASAAANHLQVAL